MRRKTGMSQKRIKLRTGLWYDNRKRDREWQKRKGISYKEFCDEMKKQILPRRTWVDTHPLRPTPEIMERKLEQARQPESRFAQMLKLITGLSLDELISPLTTLDEKLAAIDLALDTEANVPITNLIIDDMWKALLEEKP
jgi:hypothetical protein